MPGEFAAADHVTLLDAGECGPRARRPPHRRQSAPAHRPRNIARVAQALARRLAELDPAQAAHYQARVTADFSTRWTAEARLRAGHETAAPLKGVAVVSQHRAAGPTSSVGWASEVAVLEPKPGVPASAAHLRGGTGPSQDTTGKNGAARGVSGWQTVRMARAANQHPRRGVAGTRSAAVRRAADLFGLFDDTITRLVGGQPMSLDVLNPTILLPALVAGLLVISTHVPLGQGSAPARHCVHRPRGGANRRPRRDRGLYSRLDAAGHRRATGRGGAALLGALALSWCENVGHRLRRRFIGAVFVLAASAGVLL